MNVENGEFKAPYSGTYSFVFSALSMERRVQIAIKKNGSAINYVFNNNDVDADAESFRYDNISRHWIINLSKGDIINLNLEIGKLYTGNQNPVTFSGHLLHLTE